MFRLGLLATSAKVLKMPAFPHLRESNVRKGFLEDSQLHAQGQDAEQWFPALVHLIGHGGHQGGSVLWPGATMPDLPIIDL
jgi:hypothetical protein